MISLLRSRIYSILRWSEKYTKTDMVYLASGGFWLTAGQVVASFSAFILALAFANLVPQETYGTYKYLLSIAAIFSLFTLPSMSTAIARAVARNDTSTIRAATRIRVLWSLVGTLLAFAGGAYYFFNGNIELATALVLIGVVLPVFDTFTLYNAYLFGKQDFKTYTQYQLTSQSFSIAFLIGTLFVTNNIILILIAYFLPLTLIRLFIYKKISRSFGHNNSDRDTLRYGQHLSLLGILNTLATNIDKILLWKFLGPTQLAIYTFALAIPEQLKGPIKGVGDLALPKFAVKTPEQIRTHRAQLWWKLSLYGLFLLSISLLYILAAPFIFSILFPYYTESVTYSQVFALSLIVGVPTILFKILEAQKRTRDQFTITGIQMGIQISLFVILIPLYGIWGAIISIMAARLFMLASTVYSVTRIG